MVRRQNYTVQLERRAKGKIEHHNRDVLRGGPCHLETLTLGTQTRLGRRGRGAWILRGILVGKDLSVIYQHEERKVATM